MSNVTTLEMVVPHIMVVEEEKMQSLDEQEIMKALIDITAGYEDETKPTYGFIPLNPTAKDPEDAILAGWFSNTYEVSYKLIIGKEKSKDLHRVVTELANMLVGMSKELTLNMDNENIESFEEGKYRIKYGSGENRRIYQIEYKLKDSNVDNVVESLEALLDKAGEVLDDEELNVPVNRTLH